MDPLDASLICIFVFPQQLEGRALSMVRGLSDQLRSACSSVVSSAQGLPGAVQDQLASARRSAEELHTSLRNTNTLTPLLLEQSRHHLTQVLFTPSVLITVLCSAASAQLNTIQGLNCFCHFCSSTGIT